MMLGRWVAAQRPRTGFRLIGVLSGARLDKIAQLRVKDLKQDEETGIWFFDIGTDGGRSIKTTSSRRQVPVHQDLIRLGLIRHRQQSLEADGDLWFQDWRRNRDGSATRMHGRALS